MSDESSNPDRSYIDKEIDNDSLADVFVKRMLEHNLMLNRKTYLRLRYGDDQPEPWTYQHEMSLPPIFRDTNAFFTREALQRLGDAIGVTYLGEMPK